MKNWEAGIDELLVAIVEPSQIEIAETLQCSSMVSLLGFNHNTDQTAMLNPNILNKMVLLFFFESLIVQVIAQDDKH